MLSLHSNLVRPSLQQILNQRMFYSISSCAEIRAAAGARSTSSSVHSQRVLLAPPRPSHDESQDIQTSDFANLKGRKFTKKVGNAICWPRNMQIEVRNSLWKYEIHHGLLADPRDASYAPVLYGYLQGVIDARALRQLSARAWVSTGRPVLTSNLHGSAMD